VGRNTSSGLLLWTNCKLGNFTKYMTITISSRHNTSIDSLSAHTGERMRKSFCALVALCFSHCFSIRYVLRQMEDGCLLAPLTRRYDVRSCYASGARKSLQRPVAEFTLSDQCAAVCVVKCFTSESNR
jgi:hypothetical protein